MPQKSKGELVMEKRSEDNAILLREEPRRNLKIDICWMISPQKTATTYPAKNDAPAEFSPITRSKKAALRLCGKSYRLRGSRPVYEENQSRYDGAGRKIVS